MKTIAAAIANRIVTISITIQLPEICVWNASYAFGCPRGHQPAHASMLNTSSGTTDAAIAAKRPAKIGLRPRMYSASAECATV